MQKIYVLLRNDKQTGPYSLEEIIQFDLKPYDLIWIEGKSAGWYYPQEIAALHPYLNFLSKPAAPAVEKRSETKTVFVTMQPVAKAEEPLIAKAMETSSAIFGESYKPFEPVSKNIEEAVYAQFKNPVEEKAPHTNTTPVTKPKKKSTVSVGGSIVAVLIVGGVLAASWIMNRPPAENTATEAYSNPSGQNEIGDTAVAKEENTKNTKQFSVPRQKGQKNSIAPKQKTVVVKHDILQQEEPTVTTNNSVETPEDYGVTTPPVKEDSPAATKEETSTLPPAEAGAQPEKKKKLRDKILDLFKKKPAEQKTEESKPAETENGERRATRREDGAGLAQMVSIRFDVPNDWMMGIKGAKATLVNRSSEKISKAVVEVLYYDDDNNLLQKKTINFTRVGAKDSQTISVPDHSSATRIDYSIVSVTGGPAA